MAFDIDFSKFSAHMREQLSRILDGGEKGNDVNKIDRANEYAALCQLLSGSNKKDIGDAYEQLENLKLNYEEEYMVREDIQRVITDIVSRTKDKTKADIKSELDDLKDLLKTPGLNKEEISYIKRVIAGEEVRIASQINEQQGEHQESVSMEQSERPAPSESTSQAGITSSSPTAESPEATSTTSTMPTENPSPSPKTAEVQEDLPPIDSSFLDVPVRQNNNRKTGDDYIQDALVNPISNIGSGGPSARTSDSGVPEHKNSIFEGL